MFSATKSAMRKYLLPLLLLLSAQSFAQKVNQLTYLESLGGQWIVIDKPKDIQINPCFSSTPEKLNPFNLTVKPEFIELGEICASLTNMLLMDIYIDSELRFVSLNDSENLWVWDVKIEPFGVEKQEPFERINGALKFNPKTGTLEIHVEAIADGDEVKTYKWVLKREVPIA